VRESEEQLRAVRCPYPGEANAVWWCPTCGCHETLRGKQALAPFFSKHGWSWCGVKEGIKEDGDCFYHCIRLAMSAVQPLTVAVMREWVAESMTDEQLEMCVCVCRCPDSVAICTELCRRRVTLAAVSTGTRSWPCRGLTSLILVAARQPSRSAQCLPRR
jgi:hypothetical protein